MSTAHENHSLIIQPPLFEPDANQAFAGNIGLKLESPAYVRSEAGLTHAAGSSIRVWVAATPSEASHQAFEGAHGFDTDQM